LNVNPKKITITTFFISKEEYEKVSNVNKEIANRYIAAVRSHPLVKSERTIEYNAKIIGFLLRTIKTDLNKLTINDIDKIQAVISKMKRKNETDVAPTTKQQYRIGIRRFLHWAGVRCERPDYDKLAKELALDKASAPHKDAKELFTTAEIDSMIAVAKELRDKAIIATLAESGCRAGELLSCQIKSVEFNLTGCELTMEGKTGERTVDLVFASPFIDHYLRSEHPRRDDPEAPLWMSKYHSLPAALSYSGLDDIVKKLDIEPAFKSVCTYTILGTPPRRCLQKYGQNR
jgi:integrase